MSITESIRNIKKDFIKLFIGESVSDLEKAGTEIADDCTEGIVDRIDMQLGLSPADPEVKKKIAKKAKHNGLFRIKRGIDDRLQKNIERYK